MEPLLHFADKGLEPNDVTVEGIYHWLVTQVAEEILSFSRANRIRHLFIHLLESRGLLRQNGRTDDQLEPYSDPFEELAPKIQAQVEIVIESKRPAEGDMPVHRPSSRTWSPATEIKFKRCVCAIVGWLVNIEGITNIEKLEQVFREPVFRGFRSFLQKDRRYLPGPVRAMFALLISVARSHSMFPKEHFGWLDTFQKEMPLEAQEDIRGRKNGRYLLADDLLRIPAKIHKGRKSLEQTYRDAGHTVNLPPRIDFRLARLAMFELIMQILVRLAWPPRLIYRCRIGGKNPNIFLGPIDKNKNIEIDDWFKDQHARDPKAECWQYRFDPAETGSGIRQGMWPFCLIKLLKEFKELRKMLVRDKDTDTLFVNCFGTPLMEVTLREILLFITIKYADKGIPPQLCRENVAEAYAYERPYDIFGLSTVMGIGPVHAERLFGKRLNPSYATSAVENWHSERHPKVSINPGTQGADGDSPGETDCS
jgi:hypothetical protein